MYKLGPYLAGLIEGVGLISVPSTKNDSKIIKRYPSIRICFDKKDENLAKFLESTLGELC